MIQIGIIGAGANTRLKHIPLLQKIKGVEIVGVVNRTLASSKKVAEEFNIPKVYEDWRELISDRDIDAVVIGTWPYLHCLATVEALNSGKHVLTEARMGMDAKEAHFMLEISEGLPDLVTQIVPSPSGLPCDYWMRENLAKGIIGEVREIVIRSMNPLFADPTTPHNWRTLVEYSGMNIMTLGIHHEAVLRWFGDTSSVYASGRIFTENRRDPESGKMKKVEIPESLIVTSQLASGAHCVYHHSNVAHHAGPDQMEIFGSDGTLRVSLWEGTVELAKSNSKAFKAVKIPKSQIRHWTVEQDFVDAINGFKSIELTTFEMGVKYMEFTEAVQLSQRGGKKVSLPLGL